MKRFTGKVAVVTGGNSGIGLATAKRFADEGAKVAISGRSQNTLDEAAKYVGNGILAVKSDVSKPADLDRFYSAVAQKFGKIDILFVNAGVAKFRPLENADEAHYDEIFDMNTRVPTLPFKKPFPTSTTAARSSSIPASPVSKAMRQHLSTPPPKRRCARSPAPSPRNSSPATFASIPLRLAPSKLPSLGASTCPKKPPTPCWKISCPTFP